MENNNTQNGTIQQVENLIGVSSPNLQSHVYSDADAEPINSIEDLIPDELKDQLSKVQQTNEPSGQPIDSKLQDDTLEVKQTEQPSTEDTKIQQTKEEDIPEEVLKNLDIDKILEAGSKEQLESVLKGETGDKDTKKDDDIPFWHSDEEYKGLLDKLKNSKVEAKDIDEVLTKISDKKVINNSKYVQGLEKELEDLKAQATHNQKETQRLKQIEKSAFFDSLSETKEKYSTPMRNDALEMKKILDLEGESAPNIQMLLAAKNKSEFTDLVKDTNFTEQDLTRLTNHWRSYKETEFRYFEDKSKAINSLEDSLTKSISPDDVKESIREVMLNLTTTQDKYKYIKDAINNNLKDHPDEAQLIQSFNTNGTNLLQALKPELARNRKWSGQLINYVFEAEHHRRVADKLYPELKEKADKLEQDKQKLLKAVIKFSKDGVGIQGIKGGANGAMVSSGRDQKVSSEEAKKHIENFLNGEVSIEDFF